MIRKSLAAAATLSLLATACGDTSATSEDVETNEVTEIADDEMEAIGDGDAETDTETAAAAAPADAIRGPGGLEEKCLARVAQETGATVEGTNRIEESEAAIEIYVNVAGATAPWKCLGYQDGSIAEVSFTGSEGNL